ncbi:MAG: hypothetical protein C5B50_08275 [Verrucomicrobia bacterium]|nr:MAG: hypothetical protein C5B50_08275 [Verrucomicrobiota bacterium]
MKSNRFWPHFDSIPGGRALLSVWQNIFGAEFGCVQPFLQPTAERAPLLPCSRTPPCDCDHELREDIEGGFVAVCTCGDGDCPPIQVPPEQTLVYELNRQKLGHAICGALGLNITPGTASTSKGAMELGLYAPLHAPVFLYFPESEADLLRELEGLLSQRPGPILVLIPTRIHFTSAVESAQRSGCSVLALSVVLEVLEGARFRTTKSLVPALAEWTQRVATFRSNGDALEKLLAKLAAASDQRDSPIAGENELPESAATQAFALVKKLDSEEKARLGHPSVLTVFRLFCIEQLNATQIANRVRCSKLTVLRRLKLLQASTGLHPTVFRRFSSHFAEMEEQMRDPRAAHIHRKRMIYDEGEEDE